ncbi:hypothetical protein EW146_g5296 [Bondarzewia mesenterica]|uniref:Alpha/beta hydrolase fold-3 domain-containing protein n=1 Tax=Bondarzewia mesenterica TaxID=1095465 RepID=A0A4S4LS12_9AGAM|nr:hypothetical protein EW146_g5296 [Bondarzewia mesenterica]
MEHNSRRKIRFKLTPPRPFRIWSRSSSSFSSGSREYSGGTRRDRACSMSEGQIDFFIVVSTLTAVYAIRNIDKILGLGAPEPLARLYSPSYYRATWISTGMDAGFATAMAIRPKWLRDICSAIFSVYYIIYASEADEKVRRFRAVPTVEMLRVTWEKTSNPYVRLLIHRQSLAFYRRILLPRPQSSPYSRPITVHLYFSPLDAHALHKDPAAALATQEDLILDFPGGGFIAMTPEHHEERLRMWASRTGRPVISVEYGKAPEYPYPFAVDEAFDTYRILVESKGKAIGMSGKNLNVIMTGDSAGATMMVGVMIKIVEHTLSVSDPTVPYPRPSSVPPQPLPAPVAMVLNYAALDFNFTSWMTPSNLRVLRIETEADESRPRTRSPSILTRRPSNFFYKSDEDEDDYESWASVLRGAKDHLSHVSPLAVVGDEYKRMKLHRKKSWGGDAQPGSRVDCVSCEFDHWQALPEASTRLVRSNTVGQDAKQDDSDNEDADGEEDEEPVYFDNLREEDRPIEARVRWRLSPDQTAVVTPNRSEHGLSSLNLLPPPGKDVLDAGEQSKLEDAVAVADSEVTDQRKREGVQRKKEPIGTRLTMTSRTGYFQDRIISPSMMRAMAILYIGPHLNPDFATDYHISPILTPSQLLAQFPPLLMHCGEKDPFVDDTIIFAGRVREAKRQRKVELVQAISTRGGLDGARRQEMQDELARLENETEEDWVQLQVYSDWSHGYLQMPTLMHEARTVINEIADWMDEVFVAAAAGDGNEPVVESPATVDVDESSSSASARGRAGLSVLSRLWPWGKAEPIEPVRKPRITITLSQPENTDRNGEKARKRMAPSVSETETENDEGITFVPRARKPSAGVKRSAGSDETVVALDKRPEKPGDAGKLGNGNANGGDGREQLQEMMKGNGHAVVGKSGAGIDGVKQAGRGGVRTVEDEVRSEDASRGLSRSPKGTDSGGRSGTPVRPGAAPGLTGQTISEGELMRRRRLLDSHIFGSEG